jgi:rubredoxin
MMDKQLIYREDALEIVRRTSGDYAAAFAEIRKLPAADVAEVAHARWERINSNWRCTRCNRGYRITFGAPMASSFAYCPNCGAMMDGGCENA